MGTLLEMSKNVKSFPLQFSHTHNPLESGNSDTHFYYRYVSGAVQTPAAFIPALEKSGHLRTLVHGSV